MARPLRIQYPGAVYHVTCRGNERRDIFKDDADRTRFLEILRASLSIYSVTLSAYVLMSNHFHLLLETPLGNLSEFMRHFSITYTGYFNRRHARVGHLYQGRYKSILVDKGTYLSVLSRYIYLNPVKAGAIKRKTSEEKWAHLTSYPWSSLPGHIDQKKKEDFVDYTLVLSEYGGNNQRGRRLYKERMYADISEGVKIEDSIVGQSILGGPGFIQWVKDRMLTDKDAGERPSLRELYRYTSKQDIFHAIEEETGKDATAIKSEKGVLRQIAMELLYAKGGLKGPEIGALFGVGYTSVSQERRRLRQAMTKTPATRHLLERIEKRLPMSP